eukprot:255501-Prymnesium_polylepis.1
MKRGTTSATFALAPFAGRGATRATVEANLVVEEAVPQWKPAVIALGAITVPPGPRPALIGSGFVIDAHAGIIATCAHVI